jgi:hypothetical protein
VDVEPVVPVELVPVLPVLVVPVEVVVVPVVVNTSTRGLPPHPLVAMVAPPIRIAASAGTKAHKRPPLVGCGVRVEFD